MYHLYQMYFTTMSARLHHSTDLEGLREGLTWSGDAPSQEGSVDPAARPAGSAGAPPASGERATDPRKTVAMGKVIRVDFGPKPGPDRA